FVGQCEGIIAEIKKQSNASPVVVATGGLARMITEKSSAVDILDPFLTLKGLELLYRRNKPTTEK
ncbi:pantothenate kinase, partial [Escherichia coli]|nr:pantothenate kinase [Escherichia coli]